MSNQEEINKTQCFVIMPISNQVGYEDNHFQYVFEDIISPAIQAVGMEVHRADKTKNTNLIQLDILRNVIKSPMAVCDMSSKNPNVFYELGMRQAFDMPTVLIKDDSTDAPFDINGLRYVTYKKDMKHRDVIRAVTELTAALKDTYEKKDDKNEINSLIRLMDLTNPASLKEMDINDKERHERLIELQLSSLTDNINALEHSQNQIINALINYNQGGYKNSSINEIPAWFKNQQKTWGSTNQAFPQQASVPPPPTPQQAPVPPPPTPQQAPVPPPPTQLQAGEAVKQTILTSPPQTNKF